MKKYLRIIDPNQSYVTELNDLEFLTYDIDILRSEGAVGDKIVLELIEMEESDFEKLPEC